MSEIRCIICIPVLNNLQTSKKLKILFNGKLKALISPKFLDMSVKSCIIEGLNSYNILTNNSDYKQ